MSRKRWGVSWVVAGIATWSHYVPMPDGGKQQGQAIKHAAFEAGWVKAGEGK